MSEISRITAEGMIPIAKNVIDNYIAKGMKASGEFQDSIEIVETENGAVILAAGYAVQLEFGRGATGGGSSDGETLFEKISQWILDKGITANDISEQSLIFLITRKIHEQGWNRSQHGGVNLISDSISDNAFQPIIDKVFKMEQNKITERLIKILK